jgi:transcriptional regulator GlxA family with amidase domain
MTALLLVGLTENIASGESPPVTGPVAAAVTFFQNHLAQPVGMDAVAEELGLSRKQFYLRFRREMGMTPNDYLQRLRLQAAEKLLLTTDWTVETVGTESGFPRAPYFCRVFRSYFGRTPGQYREAFCAERAGAAF